MFTEQFIDKLEYLANNKPNLVLDVIGQIEKLELNVSNPNVKILDDEGYVLRIENYRLFFILYQEKYVFIDIATLDEMIEKVSQSQKSNSNPISDKGLHLIM